MRTDHTKQNLAFRGCAELEIEFCIEFSFPVLMIFPASPDRGCGSLVIHLVKLLTTS